MSIEPTQSEKSFTRAMYHLRTVKDYLETFKLDCNTKGKHQVNTWIAKINFILSDARFVLREENRDYFDKEIMRAEDILFFSNLGDMLFHLDAKQRLLLEDLATAMINNKPLTLEHTLTENKDAA